MPRDEEARVQTAYFSYYVPPRRAWDRFALSVIAHIVGLVMFTQVAARLASEQFHRVDTQRSVALVAPLPYYQSRALPPPARVKPPLVPVIAELHAPHIAPLPKPRLEAAPVPRPVLPPVITKAPVPAPPAIEPRRGRRFKETPFSGGSSAAPSIERPAKQVQTGGFGDPNGVTGTGRRDAPLTIASLGSFNLPAGNGYGNGSGGTRGVRGTIASAGFGNGIAGPGSGSGHGQHGLVAAAGFGDVTAAAASTAPARTEPKRELTPVEIISKPKPVYTEEARRLHLQGEVLLDVVFTTSGQLRVVRVVRGLGHGLDEAALQAAQQIRFRPAQRNGQPYDSNALVRIVFELAE